MGPQRCPPRFARAIVPHKYDIDLAGAVRERSMTAAQLADQLRDTYFSAMGSDAGVTVAICLFGVVHANEILASEVGIHRLCRMAGIPNLAPTVNLGVNLKEYISITKAP